MGSVLGGGQMSAIEELENAGAIPQTVLNML